MAPKQCLGGLPITLCVCVHVCMCESVMKGYTKVIWILLLARLLASKIVSQINNTRRQSILQTGEITFSNMKIISVSILKG